MKPLITVIVPVYNGEDFIKKCIDSILSQTYRNLEIIIINDGSKDNSSKLCDQFAEKDERVIVIHQENEGLSSVRNKGLDMARGEFIGFVDCDDSIHPRMYDILSALLYDHGADIAMCEATKVYNTNINKHIEKSNQTLHKQHIYTFKRDEAFGNLFNEKNLIMVVPWNKLYKREVFRNIRYPVGKISDDEFVIHHIIHATKKFVFTDATLYYYYHNERSITNKKYNLQRLDAIEAIKDRMLYFELQNYKELLQLGSNTYLHLIIIHYYAIRRSFPFEKEEMENLKRKFRREFKYYKKVISNKNKFVLKLFFIHPNIYSAFIKIRRKLSAYLPEWWLTESQS